MGVKEDIVWFDEVDKDDTGLVGGKGANLGEMTKAHFPIPFGFIVTSNAYFAHIKEANLETKIKQLLSGINYESPHELQQASKHIQELILASEMSKHLGQKIIEHYHDLMLKEEEYLKKGIKGVKIMTHKLKSIYKTPLVAVRSSATAEDLPGASFAGQQETYLNVKGETNLLQKVRECWASLFTERAIYYRHNKGFEHAKVGLAAVVQRMVQSEKSGVAFSIDPITNDKEKIVIEAIFGLGEYIVQGKVTPDHYEVDKGSFVILEKNVTKQDRKYSVLHNSNKDVRLKKEVGLKQKLSDEEILQIAILVKDIENHYYFPQDIEWAIEKATVFIVQSRPVTALEERGKKKEERDESANRNTQFTTPVLTGSPASPGIGTGPVRIIQSPKKIHEVQTGDILVAPQTNPDYVPAMKKAVAIITEKGGRTSHAAIVSRELGIPAVVGAEHATTKLKSGAIYSVNGKTGEIFKGSILSSTHTQARLNGKHKNKRQKTSTKVYVNLAQPDEAKKIAARDVDGIGLLRAEFMIANIGVHPKHFIKEKKQTEFVHRLTHDLLKFIKPFNPRPIIYRATDFKTNEYHDLKYGEKYEQKEENPMLGFRGAARYIADPAVFIMELQALKSIWSMGYRNLHLMIPFIRRPWELIKIKQIILEQGLFNFPDFKLSIMVEVPAVVLELEQFIKIGIDGVSIGTNDLTMTVLGIDRDNTEIAHLYDERAPAVTALLEHVVETCVKYKITSSICGQAASDYPEVVEKLVKLGITSVSVNPDAIEETREIVFQAEKNHFKEVQVKTKWQI